RVRPYLAECTISRPICEVKRPQASLVRRSVMVLEPGVPHPPQLFFLPTSWGRCRGPLMPTTARLWQWGLSNRGAQLTRFHLPGKSQTYFTHCCGGAGGEVPTN
ncbi:uncharacterized protein TM35_000331610, partial [Trypanosoma theileri]